MRTLKEKRVNIDLLWETLLFPGDEKHVVEEDDEHLRRLSGVKKLKGSLHQDLPETLTSEIEVLENEDCK